MVYQKDEIYQLQQKDILRDTKKCLFKNLKTYLEMQIENRVPKQNVFATVSYRTDANSCNVNHSGSELILVPSET